MSFKVAEGCDGCGMCRKACPRGAIRISGDPRIPYEIVSLDCNDCGKCAIVCHVEVIAPDPAWAACWGRGCPLSSSRFDGWACAEGRSRCQECGNSMWRSPDHSGWICSRCDEGAKVMCPKVRKATADAVAEAEQVTAGSAAAAALTKGCCGEEKCAEVSVNASHTG